MTTETIQPITDSSVQIPEYFVLSWQGELQLFSYLQLSNPIEQGIPHIWPLTGTQFNLWDEFTKEVNPSDNTLTLTFNSARHEHLHDLADGEPSNNRHSWRHTHDIWREINELRVELTRLNAELKNPNPENFTEKTFEEKLAVEADSLYRQLHGKMIHCFIDGLSEINSHLVFKSEERHKFAEKLADAIFRVIAPTDENGVLDWTRAQLPPYSYSVPTSLQTRANNICETINSLEDLTHETTEKEIVQRVIFDVIPVFAPSMTITAPNTISAGGTITTTHTTNANTVNGTAAYKWHTRADENSEWTEIEGETTANYLVPADTQTGTFYRITIGGYLDLSGGVFEQTSEIEVQ